jgi:hypothetical protein
MTKEDLELIKYYQAWRRDSNAGIEMLNPTAVGKALDKMIAYCELKFKKNDTKRKTT